MWVSTRKGQIKNFLDTFVEKEKFEKRQPLQFDESNM